MQPLVPSNHGFFFILLVVVFPFLFALFVLAQRRPSLAASYLYVNSLIFQISL